MQGKAIAALAVGASLMSLRMEVNGIEKTAWMLVLFAFLYIEFKAIDRDKIYNDNVQDTILKQEKQNLKQQEEQFNTTLGTLLNSQQQERQNFNGVIDKQNELFNHEVELTESTSGRLIPGTEPSPDIPCIRNNSGFAVIYPGGTAIVSTFPFYVLKYKDNGIITLEKMANGSIELVMDIRDRTGKIVARLDKNGYVIGSRLMFRRPNNSILIVYDEYGKEVLNIHYLNPKAISIEGSIYLPENQGRVDFTQEGIYIAANQMTNGKGGCHVAPPIPGASEIHIYQMIKQQ